VGWGGGGGRCLSRATDFYSKLNHVHGTRQVTIDLSSTGKEEENSGTTVHRNVSPDPISKLWGRAPTYLEIQVRGKRRNKTWGRDPKRKKF